MIFFLPHGAPNYILWLFVILTPFTIRKLFAYKCIGFTFHFSLCVPMNYDAINGKYRVESKKLHGASLST